MIDVFIRLMPETRVRYHLGCAVMQRIAEYPNARLRILAARGGLRGFVPHTTAEFREFDPEQFWNAARAYADDNAESEIYCVIDDDQLPLGEKWLDEGASLALQFTSPHPRPLGSHRDAAFISSVSINGENVLPPVDVSQLVGADSCGTPYFARRGTIGKFFQPNCTIGEADIVTSHAMHQAGLLTCFARTLRHNHLGYGYSQAVPDWSNHPGPRA